MVSRYIVNRSKIVQILDRLIRNVEIITIYSVRLLKIRIALKKEKVKERRTQRRTKKGKIGCFQYDLLDIRDIYSTHDARRHFDPIDRFVIDAV